MPRGRAPSPQSNRTDILQPAPVTTVPGQGYGIAAEQQAAQHSIPMANGPTMPAAQSPGAPASSGSSPAPQGAPGPDTLAALQQYGPAGDFTRPTERPNEPVTHGIAAGPGAGPEALTGIGAAARDSTVEQSTLKGLLTNLAAMPGASSAIKDLANRAQGGAL